MLLVPTNILAIRLELEARHMVLSLLIIRCRRIAASYRWVSARRLPLETAMAYITYRQQGLQEERLYALGGTV